MDLLISDPSELKPPQRSCLNNLAPDLTAQVPGQAAVQQVGGPLGVAVLGAVFFNRLATAGNYGHAFTVAAALQVVLLLTCAGLSVTLPRRIAAGAYLGYWLEVLQTLVAHRQPHIGLCVFDNPVRGRTRASRGHVAMRSGLGRGPLPGALALVRWFLCCEASPGPRDGS
jgi:hypothetical protein